MTAVCKMCCYSQSNLVKLLQIHFAISVQIKHLEGNLKVPLGSWTQKKEIQESIQHNMKTTCYTESTQTAAKVFNTEWTIAHKLCNIFTSSFILTPSGAIWSDLNNLFRANTNQMGKIVHNEVPKYLPHYFKANNFATRDSWTDFFFLFSSRVQWMIKKNTILCTVETEWNRFIVPLKLIHARSRFYTRDKEMTSRQSLKMGTLHN